MWLVLLVILIVIFFALSACGDESLPPADKTQLRVQLATPRRRVDDAMNAAIRLLLIEQRKQDEDVASSTHGPPDDAVFASAKAAHEKFIQDEVEEYLRYVTIFGSDAAAIRALTVANTAMETAARLEPTRPRPRITAGYEALQPRLETAQDAPLLTAVERSDDPQVAHDTAVLDQCRDAIAAIREDCKGVAMPSESPAELARLRAWVASLDDNHGDRVGESADAMREIDDVFSRAGTHVAGFGASAADVMQLVRARARAPENAKNRAQIERNVASAVLGVAREETCNVRLVDELVASLATLDTKDPTRGLLARGEELRAEALKSAADAAAECARELPANSAARAYLATSAEDLRAIEVSAGDEKEFRTAAVARALAAAEPALARMREDAAESCREQIRFAIE